MLVFYASSLEEFAAMKTRFVKNQVVQVKPSNPYWAKNGITFEDPDGYRVVISIIRISSNPRLIRIFTQKKLLHLFQVFPVFIMRAATQRNNRFY